MKTVSYSLRLYHFSEDEAMESISDLIGVLQELLPEAGIEYESCKSDHGHLTITVSDPVPF